MLHMRNVIHVQSAKRIIGSMAKDIKIIFFRNPSCSLYQAFLYYASSCSVIKLISLIHLFLMATHTFEAPQTGRASNVVDFVVCIHNTPILKWSWIYFIESSKLWTFVELCVKSWLKTMTAWLLVQIIQSNLIVCCAALFIMSRSISVVLKWISIHWKWRSISFATLQQTDYGSH